LRTFRRQKKDHFTALAQETADEDEKEGRSIVGGRSKTTEIQDVGSEEPRGNQKQGVS